MWGRYELIERVGAGPVAETWRARDSSSGAAVAIKKLNAELASSAVAVDQFLSVAESLRSPPHPDLVAVIDAGKLRGEPYFARAWVDGVSLEQLIGAVVRRGIQAVPPPLALTLLLPVLDALGRLHDAQLVHGHLIARNVFVLGDGAVKVTDAALARVIERAVGSHTATATSWPPPQAAPEQLSGGQADARTDVFAAGALLFELLTTCRPGDGAVEGSVIIPPAAAKHVPPILTPVLGRALERTRERRFADIKTLVAALEPVASIGFKLDADAVALATAALVGDARLPLPAPVTELLARFALAPDLPPKARKTTGDSYLIAVPPPPRIRSGAFRAVGGSETTAPPAAPPRPKTGAFPSVALAEEPGHTRLVSGAPEVPEAPMPVRTAAAAQPAPAGAVALGADEPEATRALPAVPPTGMYARAPRSLARFAPLAAGALALAVALYVAARTVIPVPEGAVDISSTPPGADVIVDGELTDRVTPTKLMLKADRPHTIELFLPGRLPWTETVRPSATAPVVIRAELKGLPSTQRSN